MDQKLAAGESAVVACSALKRRYRDLLLDGRPQVQMMFLDISHDADQARLGARHGHFFPRELLDSQFAALEQPGPPERVHLVPADGTPAQTVARIVALLT
jgi:gluconokinase